MVMKTNIEILRILFPDVQLVSKDKETEHFLYKEEAFILEFDISKDITLVRILLRGDVIHTETLDTLELEMKLPYVKGLATGKVIEWSMISDDQEIID